MPRDSKGQAMNAPRRGSITIVAWLMIVFGLAEIVTGFTHDFFGLHTARGAVSAYIGVGIGACYTAAGCLVLTMRRRAAILAMALLLVVIGGRIGMLVTGLYPVNSFRQTAAILLGTTIAAGFTIFIASQKSAFR